MADPLAPIWIDYTNHAGERRWRKITPEGIAYKRSQWHGLAWHLLAHDEEKDARREFDMRCIHAFSEEVPRG